MESKRRRGERMAAGNGGEQGPHRGLLDFPALARQMTRTVVVVGVLAVVGVIVDGLRSGLTFGVMVRWAAVALTGLLAVTVVLVALQALRGAGSAQRRGEPLSGPDVGLVPRRRQRG